MKLDGLQWLGFILLSFKNQKNWKIAFSNQNKNANSQKKRPGPLHSSLRGVARLTPSLAPSSSTSSSLSPLPSFFVSMVWILPHWGIVWSTNLELYWVMIKLFWFYNTEKLGFYVLLAIRRGKKWKIAYIYCAFCNSERQQVQNSLYLLSFLKFGEVHKCKIAYIYCACCSSEMQKVQNSVYLLRFVAIRRGEKCKPLTISHNLSQPLTSSHNFSQPLTTSHNFS